MTLDSESQDTTPDSDFERKTPEEIYEIGGCLFRQGKYVEAITVLQQSDLNNLSVQCVLGSCYLETEKYAEALGCFSKIIEANPNRREITIVLNQCALCFMAQNQWHEAITYLEQAHKRNENDPQTLTNCGICLYKMKKYNEACVFLNKALNLEPRNHLASQYLRKIAVFKHSSVLDFNH